MAVHGQPPGRPRPKSKPGGGLRQPALERPIASVGSIPHASDYCRIIERAAKLNTDDPVFRRDRLGSLVGEATRIVDDTAESAVTVDHRLPARRNGLQDRLVG